MHLFETDGSRCHTWFWVQPRGAACAACLVSVGCGSEAADKHEEPVDPCANVVAIDPTSLIDDFEDQDANLPMVAGRSGSWWAADDATAGAVFEPQGDVNPELLPEARCASRFALRVSGSGFTDWGAMIGTVRRPRYPSGDGPSNRHRSALRAHVQLSASECVRLLVGRCKVLLSQMPTPTLAKNRGTTSSPSRRLTWSWPKKSRGPLTSVAPMPSINMGSMLLSGS